MLTGDELPREAQEGPIFHPDWGTHAFEHYSGSIRALDALMAMAFTTNVDTPRSAALLRARRVAIANSFSGPWAIEIESTMVSWQIAMRVTAVEVYFQDALAFLALYLPDFMRNRGSKQTWDYDDIRTASDDDDGLWTFCSRWSRAFIAGGGPRRWSKALTAEGLGQFSPADVQSLEAMWGFRHMRIHHGHGFSRDFVRRHRAVAERIRQRGLQLADLREWADAATRFVTSAEEGIAGRLKAQLGEELVQTRFEAESERQLQMWQDRRKDIESSSSREELDARTGALIAQAEERAREMASLFGLEERIGEKCEWPSY